jgi:hypothetical protein
MNCPRCGYKSPSLLIDRTLSHPPAYVCFHCGLRWRQRVQRINWELEFFSWAGTQIIYILHALLIWSIVNVPLFFILFQHVGAVLTQPASGLIRFTLITLLTAVTLGSLVQISLFLSGWLYPQRPMVHIFVPLVTAAVIGAAHGVAVGLPGFYVAAASPIPRALSIRLIAGALGAMLATPAIIIRSSRAGAKRGLRPSLPTSNEDARWDS